MQKIHLNNDNNSNNIDKDTFREMKNELDASRRHVQDLSSEVDSLRREKEQ